MAESLEYSLEIELAVKKEPQLVDWKDRLLVDWKDFLLADLRETKMVYSKM